VQINQTFSSDTILAPFSGSTPVYSLSMSGGVNLLSDSSLVRVVLIDTYGNHYMVYEAYPLITLENAFDTLNASDETTYLDGAVCDSLRIDIISAFLDLDSLKLDTNYIPNATELQAQAKWNHDSVKIVIMNQRIVEENMYWRAGRSNLSLLTHFEKEQRFSQRYFLEGYDFFIGGVYQQLTGSIPPAATEEIVSGFDWRKRHYADYNNSPYYNPYGYGWITSLKPQIGSSTCWAFSTTALEEAYANLYFNNNLSPTIPPGVNHQINMDLSEMQLIRCYGNDILECDDPQDVVNVMAWINDHYMMEDDCFPMDCTSPLPNCPTSWPSTCDRIMTSGSSSIENTNEDVVKSVLIKYGPISCKFTYSTYAHQRVLVGYGVAKTGDTVYEGTGPEDPPIILDENCPFLGTTEWIFKDNNNFVPILSLEYMTSNFSYYMHGEIDRPVNGTQTPIICTDEDGDGYYWWGIHWDNNGNQVDPIDCNCPPGVKVDEEDCNDNDVNLGPYNLSDPEIPLYSCILNECITQANPLYIESDDTWTIGEGDRHINQDIIINTGVTLTIECQVFLTPQAKIIIQPGGVLELSGTYINPARISSGCGEFWKGIQLWGDPTQRQTAANQGQIIIEHGIIENAACGIMTGNPDYIPEGGGQGEPYPVYPSGGIIQAKYAIFRNNHIGIEFYPYRDGDDANKSYLRGCLFITDDALLNGSTPDYFLKLDGINKLDIHGCTFQNTRDEDPQILYTQRGKGIYLYNSDIYMNDTIMDSYHFDLIFENLEYGINGLHSGLGPAWLTLHNASFFSNQSGVYLSGYHELNPVAIYDNDFDFSFNYDSDNQYGIYLDQCSGYEVQLNTMTGDLELDGNQYGILVNNSGARTNYIYDNDFYDLHSALQGQNVNRGYYLPDIGVPLPEPEPETGLCFKCNNFYNCVNDIIVTDEDVNPDPASGITLYQGCDKGANSPTAQKEPAGNTFSAIEGQTDHVYDIDMDESVHNIIYIHHHDHDYFRVIPDKEDYVHNPDKVTLEEHRSPYAVYDPTESCPDYEYPTDNLDSLEFLFNESKEKIDSLIALLVQIVDEGSTEEKNEMVQTSLPNQSSEVYLDLMGNSPYLSDTVLRSSVEKEEVLSNAMITDIMVANPQSAKNDNILTALDERFVPLSDSMWVEILKGVDTVADREQIEAELSGWIQLKEKLFNAICKLYLMDTVNQGSQDSLLIFMKTDHIFSTQFLLANFYIDRKMFSSSDSLLESLLEYYSIRSGDDSTRQRLQELIPILEELFVDTVGNLVPDSAQRLELLVLSENPDIPGVFARNILIANDFLEYREPIFSTSSLKTVRRYRYTSSAENKLSSAYKVYPNPCNEYLTVESIRNLHAANIEVAVFNSNNQLISSQRFPVKRNILILSFKEQSAGIYLVRIIHNGLSVETHKVIHLD